MLPVVQPSALADQAELVEAVPEVVVLAEVVPVLAVLAAEAVEGQEGPADLVVWAAQEEAPLSEVECPAKNLLYHDLPHAASANPPVLSTHRM